MYRTISTLPCAWPGDGQPADCGNQSYGIGYPYGFGWAAKGFTPDVKSGRAAKDYALQSEFRQEAIEKGSASAQGQDAKTLAHAQGIANYIDT